MDFENLNLIAPDSFWELTKEEIKKYTNGCGPKKLNGYRLIPDKIWFVSIEEACRIHDWEYYMAESCEDKRKADCNFLLNLLEITDKRSKTKLTRWFRDHMAFRYFIAVYYGGDLFLEGC